MSGVLLPILGDRPAAFPAVSPSVPPERGRALPVRLATLGCKVNQYETEYARELLLANGYREAAPDEPAALAVVNTCTVTSESDRKSRKLIYQFARANPGVRIVVMGCYATAAAQAVARLPGVAAVVTDKRSLVAALRPFGVTRDVAGIRRFEGHQRAFVKVQDGCILQCTFCIIPSVRPGLASRPPEEITREVAGLVAAGYREIVLAGIHLGHYGLDWSRGRPRREWCRLPELLERLVALPGEFRIRLSSLEATEVTDDLVRVMGGNPARVCPHLHLSLQSGSDAVLSRMKRRYRVRGFMDRVDRLRARLDRPGFSTDIIVGFPGETERDFEQTVAAVRAVGFAKVHVFPFSPRQGTRAATYSDTVSEEAKRAWRERLAAEASEAAREYCRSLVGRRLELLVETPDLGPGPGPGGSGWMRGTTCRGVPAVLECLPALRAQLVPVIARGLDGDRLVARPLAADKSAAEAIIR